VKVLLLTTAALFVATTVAATAAEVVTPAPAPAPEAVPAPVTAPADKRDPNARVCKTSPVIGTRVPSRICMTRAEWVARSEADRRDLETAQRNGLATCGTKPCS
jgi:hypothetical protein